LVLGDSYIILKLLSWGVWQ